MKKLNLIALAMLVGLISASAPAFAASSPRTYVSTKGADNSGCQVTYPCLTINYALTQTSAGGEVIVVDSANFAPLTITKSVTIETAPGVYAGITPATDGVAATVNGTSGAIVVLRGLTFQGGSGFTSGILFNSGAALHVENCVINGMQGVGIAQGGGNLFVKDTVIRNCGLNGVETGGSTPRTSLSHVWLENNSGSGLWVGSGKVTITDSVISGNTLDGVNVPTEHNGNEANVASCEIANNGNGIEVGGLSTARVSNSTVTDNTGNGLLNDGTGTLYSRQNNTVAGNAGGDTSGTITPLPAI